MLDSAKLQNKRKMLQKPRSTLAHICIVLLIVAYPTAMLTLSTQANPLVEPQRLIQALDCEHIGQSESAEIKHLCQLYLYAATAAAATATAGAVEDIGARNTRPSRSLSGGAESIFYPPASKHLAEGAPVRSVATRAARNSPSDMMSLLTSGVGDDALGADAPSSWNSRFNDDMSMNRWQPMRGKRYNQRNRPTLDISVD